MNFKLNIIGYFMFVFMLFEFIASNNLQDHLRHWLAPQEGFDIKW
jgi:hypothetical protein